MRLDARGPGDICGVRLTCQPRGAVVREARFASERERKTGRVTEATAAVWIEGISTDRPCDTNIVDQDPMHVATRSAWLEPGLVANRVNASLARCAAVQTGLALGWNARLAKLAWLVENTNAILAGGPCVAGRIPMGAALTHRGSWCAAARPVLARLVLPAAPSVTSTSADVVVPREGAGCAKRQIIGLANTIETNSVGATLDGRVFACGPQRGRLDTYATSFRVVDAAHTAGALGRARARVSVVTHRRVGGIVVVFRGVPMDDPTVARGESEYAENEPGAKTREHETSMDRTPLACARSRNAACRSWSIKNVRHAPHAKSLSQASGRPAMMGGASSQASAAIFQPEPVFTS